MRCQLCKFYIQGNIFITKSQFQISLSQRNVSCLVSTAENVEATTSANALKAGMVIIAKSGDFSDLFVQSLAEMVQIVNRMAHVNAKRDGPGSFVTPEISVGEILQSCQEDNFIGCKFVITERN